MLTPTVLPANGHGGDPVRCGQMHRRHDLRRRRARDAAARDEVPCTARVPRMCGRHLDQATPVGIEDLDRLHRHPHPVGQHPRQHKGEVPKRLVRSHTAPAIMPRGRQRPRRRTWRVEAHAAANVLHRTLQVRPHAAFDPIVVQCVRERLTRASSLQLNPGATTGRRAGARPPRESSTLTNDAKGWKRIRGLRCWLARADHAVAETDGDGGSAVLEARPQM